MESENAVGKFRKECEEVSARFGSYPAVYLEYMGDAAWMAAVGELRRRKVPQRVLSLLEGGLLLMLAAEQVRRGKLDALNGMSVAETLPVICEDLVAMNGGEWPG